MAVLVVGLWLVRVEATVAQLAIPVTIALAKVARKRMATRLVLVVLVLRCFRVAVAVDIGAVGVRLSRHNLIVVQRVDIPVAVADLVSRALTLRLFSTPKE